MVALRNEFLWLADGATIDVIMVSVLHPHVFS